MPDTILHTLSISSEDQSKLLEAIPGELVKRQDFHLIRHDLPVTRERLTELRSQFQFDINTIPQSFQCDKVALLITDMDSTLITIECVDEIADFLGLKEQVAKITESAMRGEIDFNTSLSQRVRLLKGLEYNVLERVYRERLRLNPGAEILLSRLHEMGVKTALVSGGFKFFTDRLKERLNLDFTLSNILEEQDGQLTGNVLGNIVNGNVKAEFLSQLAGRLGIEKSQIIAVGDGANDLPMMSQSGLGVAYRAKPKVQEQADVVLNHADLDAILHFVSTSND